MSETVHTSILLALISGIIMAFLGVIFARICLELMDTPEDVIDLSTLYMRIYFLGMPFLCCITMAQQFCVQWEIPSDRWFFDHFRLCKCASEPVFVIVCHLSVAGVGIGTVISQLISCIFVLRCLYQTEGSYQLRFSSLSINMEYLKQIFRVGLPAGIQSTVINFSNVLLQSSVNSFGSIAMAGYTAANNIFGFLYVSVNSVTQACMSFTSQNYGVRKPKRMDRVLVDCMILSFAVSFAMGCGAYFFGPQLLKIYTEDLRLSMRNGDSCLYHSYLFPLRPDGSVSGSTARMGRSGVPMILSIIGTVGLRIVWIFGIFPAHRSLKVLFISYPASWIFTIVMQVICFWFVRRKVHRQLLGENA